MWRGPPTSGGELGPTIRNNLEVAFIHGRRKNFFQGRDTMGFFQRVVKSVDLFFLSKLRKQPFFLKFQNSGRPCQARTQGGMQGMHSSHQT